MFDSLGLTAAAQAATAYNPLAFRHEASQQFERALLLGKARSLAGRLLHKQSSLRQLPAVGHDAQRRPVRHSGVVSVPLARIVGSEGRANDFDGAFRPLTDHTRDRWIGIAAARRAGAEMPPVELIQVGDGYFVRDGHHRISVARAAGQREIEAQVVYTLSKDEG